MRTRIDGSCLVRFGSDSIVTGSENWTAIARWILREWIEGFRGQGRRGTVDRHRSEISSRLRVIRGDLGSAVGEEPPIDRYQRVAAP